MTAPTAYLTIPRFPGAQVRSLGIWSSGAGTPPDMAAAAALADRAAQLGLPPLSAEEFAVRALAGWRYESPFTGEPISAGDAVELCGFWQKLIDSNRDIVAAVGFAFWKRESAASLLWGGHELKFARRPEDVPAGSTAAVWRSRTSPTFIDALEQRGCTLVEVEDGFIRSSGLGADCVPPLSLVVDRLGAHFDPRRPSELEDLIQRSQADEAQLRRAAALRASIVDNGLSKYEADGRPAARTGGNRRHILVPGQVEDDRSVIEGGGDVRSNLELLKRVRTANPDAYILYKPHPDVEAGHRVGSMPDAECLAFADQIVRGVPISGLIAAVDEVHVITSLAGFEALLRGKPVTTYGIPFYAGWGLTTDRGQVPARRTARPSLDQLVAAVLLEYPRYLDPVSGLPCPAEIVVERLIAAQPSRPGLIVGLRRVQGKLMRRFRTIGR